MRICTKPCHKDLYKTLAKILIHEGRTWNSCKIVVEGFCQNLWEATKIMRRESDLARRKCREACASHVKIRTAIARAIWHAQHHQRVARVISKFAPRHDESDPTCTKSREGCARCASTCWILTKHCAHRETWILKTHVKKNKDDVLPRSPPLFGRGLRYADLPEKWARGIRHAWPAALNHHTQSKKWPQVHKRDFRPFQNVVQVHQILPLLRKLPKSTSHLNPRLPTF